MLLIQWGFPSKYGKYGTPAQYPALCLTDDWDDRGWMHILGGGVKKRIPNVSS